MDVPENVTIERFFRTNDFFDVMKEKGIDMSSAKTKKLSLEIIADADTVISMAEEPFIPDFLRESKKVVWWGVENPTFATREVSERTYEQIRSLVEGLI